MSLSTKKSIFLIQSSTTKSIGTGFVVYADEQGAYLVTCMHVVEACDKDALEVHGQKAELIKEGLIEEIDLALLYVKGLENTEALKLCSDAVSEDTLVEIEGFKRHKKNNIKLAKLEKIDGVVKKVSQIYANHKQISTYELSIEKEDSIEQGYSGATVVLKGTNTVIAVATDRERNGKNAYAIPISYLKEIWEEMPEFINCQDAMQEKSKEKKPFLKKLEDQALNTIAGVIVLAVITGFIYDAVKPKESTPASSSITIGNGNSNVTVNQTIGVSDNALKLIIAPYIKDIKRLEEQLKKSTNDEEKLKLSELLNRANEEKAKKDKEIAKLKELIDNAQYKIVKEAKVVFENEGIEKALEFLQNSKTKEQEQLLNANMKEWAEKYRLEAQLLVLQNQYHKAKEAYKKALNYDRNVETLFDYAHFLQTQNYFDEAIQTYNGLLLEQRTLAKSNPKVYNDKVATTLNNLAVLYKANNQMQKAEEAYSEALTLRRALAKSNPKVYNAKVAGTLNNLAILYKVNNQMQKAEEAYGEALTLYRVLAKNNPKVYNAYMAGTLNNLAVLYYANNQMQKAEEAYSEALTLRRALAKSNPKVYNAKVAGTLNNLGLLYKVNNQMQKAEEAYSEALTLYSVLAKNNPKVYNADVAGTLNNLANLYRANNQMQKAEEAYGEALTLYRALVKSNRKVYKAKVAMTLNNLALLYKAKNQMQKAEEAYGEALSLRRALAKSNPKVYNADVADTLNNLAILYKVNNQMQKAEEAYSEALTLYRALAKNNPKVYNDKVATTLNNLANLYSDNNQMQKAEEAYGEALSLRRALAKSNPKVYGIVLANSLVMGVDMLNQPSENLDEAEKILQGFRGIPKAEWLLGKIGELRQR